MRFVLDLHCHTVASGHASGTIEEILAEAKAKKLELVGIADHGPFMPNGCTLDYFKEILALPKVINGMPWLKGVEANITNEAGEIDIPNDMLAELDFCIASIHSSLYLPKDPTAAIIGAMQNPQVNIIGHLGDPRVPIEIPPIIAAAKQTNTLIEINNKSLIPDTRRYGGKDVIKELLRMCSIQNIPVIAGSDAHEPKQTAGLGLSKSLIESSAIDESLVINTSVEKLMRILKHPQIPKF